MCGGDCVTVKVGVYVCELVYVCVRVWEYMFGSIYVCEYICVGVIVSV
jgi:hypothetical protein